MVVTVAKKNNLIWDQSLIEKYNYSGPRYTSYPTALEFNSSFSETDFIAATQRYPKRPLSLYVHIPFCHKLCYFCACNKMVTRQKQKVAKYLVELEKECTYRSSLFSGRTVTQLHLGGGTPTFLSQVEISQLMKILRHNFMFSEHAEISIEIDPRDIPLDMLDHLKNEGFNRISIGIQDFDKEVQQLVNREQDESFIAILIQHAKQLGFRSINLDLIYGLPKQTTQSFLGTLARVVALSPDRLSVFNYAHLPNRFAAQRKIKETDLPSADEKLVLLQSMIQYLTAANYHYIGMDHFAKPDDELAIAQQQGQLHRNFQGYTTQSDTDLLGLGVSAISMIGDSYAQNEKELSRYYAAIETKKNALTKGLVMTKDDCIRRDVIKSLICNFMLDFSVIESRYCIDFQSYFKESLSLLLPMQQDQLIRVEKSGLVVTAKGRLLIRHLCMCFDYYLMEKSQHRQFSRII